MEITNEKIIRNIINACKIARLTPTEVARKSNGLVTQSTLSKLLNFPEESNPTLKTLRGVAKATRTSPWMFLLEDFPFEQAKKEKQLKKISKEGYILLKAFEEASPETKLTMLKQAGYLLDNYDNNKHSAQRVRETAKKYMKEKESI